MPFRPERGWEDDPALAPDAVRRVLLLGDVHGSGPAVRAAVENAVLHDCQAVVQLGDFWLSDGSTMTVPRIKTAGSVKAARAAPIPVVALDGNHEVWPVLDLYKQRHAAAHGRRPSHLSGQLWWARRGTAWTWAGRRFAALGGAASPDKWMPETRRLRWKSEEPTATDFDRLDAGIGAEGGLDVLLCHNAPAGTEGLRSGLDYEIPARIAEADAEHRRRLAEAVEEHRPRLVVHGHWHCDNLVPYGPTRSTLVLGLGVDSMQVLDLDDLITERII